MVVHRRSLLVHASWNEWYIAQPLTFSLAADEHLRNQWYIVQPLAFSFAADEHMTIVLCILIPCIHVGKRTSSE